MAEMQTMTAATLSGALVLGMTLALFGRLKSALARRPHGDDGQLRHLLLMLYIALIPMTLLCGVLVDNYGARPILIAGSAALAMALTSLSMRTTHPHSFAAILLAALGAAALLTTTTTLMPRALFAGEETSASLNLGYVFIALGAVLATTLLDLLFAPLGPRRTLTFFALTALLPAFFTVLPGGDSWRAAEPNGAPFLFAEPSNVLAALVFLFYVPLEASFGPWTYALLAERQREERLAAGVLMGFWSAFVASRLTAAALQHVYYLPEWWDRCFVVLAPLLAAILLGNLSGSGSQRPPRLGLIVLGLLLGPVLPTLLGLLFRRVAPSNLGLAYGIAFAAGSLGSLLAAPLLTPSRQARTILRVPIFLALLLTTTALVLGLMTS